MAIIRWLDDARGRDIVFAAEDRVFRLRGKGDEERGFSGKESIAAAESLNGFHFDYKDNHPIADVFAALDFRVDHLGVFASGPHYVAISKDKRFPFANQIFTGPNLNSLTQQRELHLESSEPLVYYHNPHHDPEMFPGPGTPHLFFQGGPRLSMLVMEDLKDLPERYDLHLPEDGLLGGCEYSVAQVIEKPSGLVLVVNIFDASGFVDIGWVLLSHHDYRNVIDSCRGPLFSPDIQWQKAQTIDHLGTIVHHDEVLGYWKLDGEAVHVVNYPMGNILRNLCRPNYADLRKEKPMLVPKSDHTWEDMTCFNPAALHIENRVHLLYRAQGHDYVSRIGYAVSEDGVSIAERLDDPIYCHYEEVPQQVSLTSYASGGGLAGAEDPRATLVEDRIYMAYVAYDGLNPPRLAMTSIHLEDFLARRWLWTRPVIISPPGIVDKSGVVFPEKVKGKYVMMHRIFPHIQIDYRDSLEFTDDDYLHTRDIIPIRPDMWDSRKIGAGAPPLKTSEGWLLIYYGVDDRNDKTYNIGAMLLDLENPSKVLYRSNQPILTPDEWFENEGFKPGIAYPCGAVIHDGTLFIYYGAADNYVCVAHSPLDTFLERLKNQVEFREHEPQITKMEISE